MFWVRAAPVAPPPPLVHQGSLLTLQGAGAYDAAVHCASVSAARRILSARGDTPTHYQAAAAGGHPSMRNPFDPHAPYTPRSVRAPRRRGSPHDHTAVRQALGFVVSTAGWVPASRQGAVRGGHRAGIGVG